MKLKKNDNVIMLTGKDRGQKGKILKVLNSSDQVLVEGLNLKNKRQKPRKEGDKGQTLKVAHPVHMSNVALFCSSCDKGVRIGSKLIKDKKVRVCKKCGKEF